MKLNIAICDDDEAAIEYLKSCITHFYLRLMWRFLSQHLQAEEHS